MEISANIAATWESRTEFDRGHFLRSILDRVLIHADHIEIRIRVPQLIQQLVGTNRTAGSNLAKVPDNLVAVPFQQVVSIECPFHHVSQGRALRLIVGNNQIITDASRQAIPKAIARARRWYEQIIDGEVASLPDIARREKINYAYVKKIFPLALLSPTRIEALFTGTAAAISLDSLLGDITMHWNG
ncbi:MAG: hypothetical protein ACLQG3_02660 [Terracidiphilus sp.]